jgi:hypothetical protein
MHGKFKTVAVIGLPHGMKTVGHTFRVAVLAAGADFRATGYRVPGAFGPFNP